MPLQAMKISIPRLTLGPGVLHCNGATWDGEMNHDWFMASLARWHERVLGHLLGEGRLSRRHPFFIVQRQMIVLWLGGVLLVWLHFRGRFETTT